MQTLSPCCNFWLNNKRHIWANLVQAQTEATKTLQKCFSDCSLCEDSADFSSLMRNEADHYNSLHT